MSEVRLINANKMKDHVAFQKDILANMGGEDMEEIGNLLVNMITDEINIQPTVDAVPVEWWNELKKTVSELVENNKDIPENKQFYDCAWFLLNLMNVIEERSET